ncbi:hypothetical protein JHK84_032310 [Glycine max]|nr:hypothetical protein JHK84_032310 [Glycine max]
MSEGVRRCAEGSGSDADGSGFDVLRDRLVVIEERSERKKNADPNVVYAILCLSPNNCSHFISQPKWCGSYTQGTQSIKFIPLWGSCANALMVKVANVEAHGRMMLAPTSCAIRGNIIRVGRSSRKMVPEAKVSNVSSLELINFPGGVN